MCKFSSKCGGVPFQISFFLGDLTRNDPLYMYIGYWTINKYNNNNNNNFLNS